MIVLLISVYIEEDGDARDLRLQAGTWSRSAVTSSDPDINLLETSLKSVECPCDEPLARLTRNYIFQNKF